MSTRTQHQSTTLQEADVVLIGGGIMSATLGSMLAVLEPHWRIVMLEKADELANESSDPWNNAGTGHSGYCRNVVRGGGMVPAHPREVSTSLLNTASKLQVGNKA